MGEGMCHSPCTLLPNMLYLKHKKEQPPTRWVDLVNKLIELPPFYSAKVPGWFFYALKHHLINVKTDVSNARMNIPKAMRSLKSK